MPLLQGVPAGKIVAMKLLMQCEHTVQYGKGRSAVGVNFNSLWLMLAGKVRQTEHLVSL